MFAMQGNILVFRSQTPTDPDFTCLIRQVVPIFAIHQTNKALIPTQLLGFSPIIQSANDNHKRGALCVCRSNQYGNHHPHT